MSDSFFEHMIIDQQHLLAYASDLDTYDILYMTQAAASLYGFKNAGDCYGKKCYDLIEGWDAPCPFCTTGKLSVTEPCRWEHFNEKLQRWMDITAVLVEYQGKNVRFEIMRDITEQKEQFARVFSRLTVEETLVDCIQTLSGESDVTVAVNRFLELIGHFYAADRAYIFEYGKDFIRNTFEWCAPGISQEIENLQKIPMEYIEEWNDKFEHDGEFFLTSLGGNYAVNSPEYRILNDQGIKSLCAAPLKRKGEIIGLLGVDNPTENGDDLSLLRSVCSFVLEELERRRLMEELERSSYIDLLTGLNNRNCYIKALKQLSCCETQALGVIYIDINGMKKLNDSFGHEYGDRVIQNVAQLLKMHVQRDVYRVGGDEFVVLCENMAQPDFLALMEKLRRIFEENKDYSVSIGCTWKDGKISASKEMPRADERMYAQKQAYYQAQNTQENRRENGELSIGRKKILVVEDNEINREILKGILSPDYEVVEAENGQEALDVLQTQKEGISLILLDIVMPVMDGYAFLSYIRADAAYSLIPVVVTTQSSSEESEVEALSHGATDFVSKPYRPEIIRHRVAGLIRLRETAAMVNQLRYDRLTGICSKEYFYQRVKETLAESPEKEYNLICSNVENFKLVNDVFGVATGDYLLKGIAKICQEFVGEKGICGRIGADQFACMVDRSFTYTGDLFKDIICRINDLSCAKNVRMKWGVYAVEDKVVPVEQMCDRALLAAHSIKGQYNQFYAVYDDTLREELLREQTITNEMATALSLGQFEVYLQPKYRLEDGVLAGAEALVRWNHPEQGILSPATFIPLFEKNGFIIKLDQFVWDKTCAVLRQWDDKGYPPLNVSVNVSRADIYNADLPEFLLKTIRKYGLSLSRLPLEITESAYTENPSQIIETVESLKKMGFLIEMDDFGSGYSSLNMLNQLPLDILKLDMQFIRSETAKPKSQGILRYIMDIAGTMGLRVVAEGVETGEQLERLREVGCDYGQGYYFAKPMPWKAFETLMKEPGNLITH